MRSRSTWECGPPASLGKPNHSDRRRYLKALSGIGTTSTRYKNFSSINNKDTQVTAINNKPFNSTSAAMVLLMAYKQTERKRSAKSKSR